MRLRRAERWVIIVGLLQASAVALAAPPVVEDPEEPVPGVFATFSAAGEAAPLARRIVPDLTGVWGRGAPDPRVPADGFTANWSGLLLIQAPGGHQFFVRADGPVTLKVAGQVVLEGNGDAARSTRIDLPVGFVPIVLDYRHQGGDARVAVDWEGPTFAREPLPTRLLFHDRQVPFQTDAFDRGRRAADRYGCANCHTLLDLSTRPHLGPPLAEAARSIGPAWLRAWLKDPATVRPKTRMPRLGHGLSNAEVADVAAFLASVVPKKAPIATNEIKMALNVGTADKGQVLFRSLGCLGCHVRGSKTGGAPSEPAGPDLSDLGRKRSAEWIASYLVRPKSARSIHRADFRLTADESAYLAAYLISDPPRALTSAETPPGDATRGRALVERARCASCHEIPGMKPKPADLPLRAGANPRAGCLAEGDPAAFVPRFGFPAEVRADLASFVANLPRTPSPTSLEARAQDALSRWNCLGCHVRDGQGGTDLGGQIASLLAEDPALGGLKGTLTPPNLTAVGDKLRPDYLAEILKGAAPSARPWLSVRMPAFAFEPGEAEAIASLFQNHDQMRLEPEARETESRPDAHTLERAGQLIGQRGFGCISCHVLAGRIPPGGEPETLGPDLALAHRRMSERYFQRWIANPQRIIAGTPMPQFLQPVATTPGSLDDQLTAIWSLLGSPRVGEVAAFGTREFLKREGDRALVVRDMVLLPGAPGTPYTPRALAIGLKNDHTLLFDTDRLTWLSWWAGGFLSRTKSGRLWEWHPEGQMLWVAPGRPSPVAFWDESGKLVLPVEQRERFGSFRELDFEGSGVVLTYTLNLPNGGRAQVVERVQPARDGWDRDVSVTGVPNSLRPVLIKMPPAPLKDEGADAIARWEVGDRRVSLRVSPARALDAVVPGVSEAKVLGFEKAERGEYGIKVQLRFGSPP